MLQTDDGKMDGGKTADGKMTDSTGLTDADGPAPVDGPAVITPLPPLDQNTQDVTMV